MSIKIIKAAVLTSLVSDGRVGFRSWGIGPSGAMDLFAMNVANFLVGNDREAVLEVGYSSAEIFFNSNNLISLTGKGFDATVNDETIPWWRPFHIKKDSILKLKKKSGGSWAYLALHGGWKAQEWLKSYTTNLSATAGGFNGRMLRKDDVIEVNGTKILFEDMGTLPWGISTKELEEVYSPANTIRCIPSTETGLMSVSSREKLTSSGFLVDSQSNRMGYRLKGVPLSLQEKNELISSPVDFGTIQLLPDGNLIVLMADHQTTGGYPRIASVIRADLTKLSQIAPGEDVKFKMISLEEAEAELISREQGMNELRESCRARIEKHLQ